MTEGKRHGYWVEGCWFDMRIAQARANARHLANNFGRDVPITLFNGHKESIVAVYKPGGDVQNVTPGGSDGAAADV